ncbi:hypothetical protein GYB22_01460 [bacterium]|nr:hypothetical protein [bacterium]
MKDLLFKLLLWIVGLTILSLLIYLMIKPSQYPQFGYDIQIHDTYYISSGVFEITVIALILAFISSFIWLIMGWLNPPLRILGMISSGLIIILLSLAFLNLNTFFIESAKEGFTVYPPLSAIPEALPEASPEDHSQDTRLNGFAKWALGIQIVLIIYIAFLAYYPHKTRERRYTSSS